MRKTLFPLGYFHRYIRIYFGCQSTNLTTILWKTNFLPALCPGVHGSFPKQLPVRLLNMKKLLNNHHFIMLRFLFINNRHAYLKSTWQELISFFSNWSQAYGESIKSRTFTSKIYLPTFWGSYKLNWEYMWIKRCQNISCTCRHWVHANISSDKLAEFYFQTLSACEY